MTTDEGVQKAQKYNVMFVETSAKTMAGINTLFDNLIEVITGEEEADTTNNGGNQGGAGGRRFVITIETVGNGGDKLNKEDLDKKDLTKKKKCCGK